MKKIFNSPQRGSALITVLIFTFLLVALVGSVLKYSTFERRLNNRAKLLLEARTAAETISEYGIAQVKNILELNRTFTNSTWRTSDEALFTTGGGGTYDSTTYVKLPDPSFWGGGHIVTNTGIASEIPKINVGKILNVSNGVNGLFYVDPAIYPDDSLAGKRIFRYDLDILSRATAVDSFGSGNVTKYMKQTFTIRAVPLFTNAVYYNMDMEVQPGPDMTITGATHCNGRMFVRSASSSPVTINFAGPVVAVKGFWTNFTSSPTNNYMPFFQSINDAGALQTNATTGIVSILKKGTTGSKPMQLTTGTAGFSPNLPTGRWVESTWDKIPTGETWQQHINDPSLKLLTPVDPGTADFASKQNFANWCDQTFAGNLKTEADGVTADVIQGIPDYSYAYGSIYPDPITGASDAAYTYSSATGNDINNSAHALIETPRLSTPITVTNASYNAATEAIKYAHNVSLYIVANTTGSPVTNGHKPDGTLIPVPARSYRAFMNDTNTSPYTITEVILPGQDTFGDAATPNPYAAHRNARPVVQIMNIDLDPASPTFNQEKTPAITLHQRQMTDLRRTDGGDTALGASSTFKHSAARGATNQYKPKIIKTIDIDMTELKKAVRTMLLATGTTSLTTDNAFYSTGFPVSATYASYIYNPTATPTNVTLDDTTRIITTNTGTLTNAFTATIWNGAVYIESIAADQFDVTPGATAADIAVRQAKTHTFHSSGVRLINGRGKVPSLDPNVGFTLATNDAAYILGTFNADGLFATPAVVSVNVPAVPGASTGHNYEVGELPASIVADAVTLLSQPFCPSATKQTAGWNDAFSKLTNDTANYSGAWQTSPPSNSNRRDGDSVNTFPYAVPYDSDNTSFTTDNVTEKCHASFTEYSVALLCGLVPTGKNGVSQTSGGLHNFPRFLEDWSGVDCRIRGSMVALFECRVANDPWNLRVYNPPHRVWGFNLLFDEGKMPPLTPKTLVFNRAMANDITKADYNAKLTLWSVPNIP